MPHNRFATKAPKNRPVLRISIALLLLGLLIIWAARTLWQEDYTIVPIRGFILAVLVSGVSVISAAWRMQVLSEGRVSLATGSKSIALVASLLIVFPSRLSDLVKPVYLLERASLELSKGFSILFYERALDVFVLLGMLAILIFAQGAARDEALIGSTTLLSALAVTLVLVFSLLIFAPNALVRAVQNLPFDGLKRMTIQFLYALTNSTPVLTKAGVLSVIVWANSYLIFYVYLVHLNTEGTTAQIGALAVLLVFIAGALGLFVTVTPGGIGTYEFAIALALSTYGIPVVEGLVHGLMLRLIVLVPNILLLLYILVFDGFNFRDLYHRIWQIHGKRHKTEDTQ